MRPLLGDKGMNHNEGSLLFHSLQKGPVTPPHRNVCSNIPNRGTGVCTMNVAGDVAVHSISSPPAFPKVVLDVSMASSTNRTYRDHPSS
ncbi:hypothetical protein M5689_003800 [Euphorbia peplus]|nr:hypothetical protein M5689_003800 [Euphorbia peplus]